MFPSSTFSQPQLPSSLHSQSHLVLPPNQLMQSLVLPSSLSTQSFAYNPFQSTFTTSPEIQPSFFLPLNQQLFPQNQLNLLQNGAGLFENLSKMQLPNFFQVQQLLQSQQLQQQQQQQQLQQQDSLMSLSLQSLINSQQMQHSQQQQQQQLQQQQHQQLAGMSASSVMSSQNFISMQSSIFQESLNSLPTIEEIKSPKQVNSMLLKESEVFNETALKQEEKFRPAEFVKSKQTQLKKEEEEEEESNQATNQSNNRDTTTQFIAGCKRPSDTNTNGQLLFSPNPNKKVPDNNHSKLSHTAEHHSFSSANEKTLYPQHHHHHHVFLQKTSTAETTRISIPLNPLSETKPYRLRKTTLKLEQKLAEKKKRSERNHSKQQDPLSSSSSTSSSTSSSPRAESQSDYQDYNQNGDNNGIKRNNDDPYQNYHYPSQVQNQLRKQVLKCFFKHAQKYLDKFDSVISKCFPFLQRNLLLSICKYWSQFDNPTKREHLKDNEYRQLCGNLGISKDIKPLGQKCLPEIFCQESDFSKAIRFLFNGFNADIEQFASRQRQTEMRRTYIETSNKILQDIQQTAKLTNSALE